MPTPLTHGLVGVAFAQAAPEGISKPRLAVLLAACGALPDIDLAAFFVGISYTHPLGHRGFTHSLVFAAIVGSVAGVFWLKGSRRQPGNALRVGLLVFAATASHGLLDAATNGGRGVGFMIPFFQDRIFLPFRPIVVAPFSPTSFLDRAACVFLSELVWVWLPLLTCSTALALTRRRGHVGARHRIP